MRIFLVGQGAQRWEQIQHHFHAMDADIIETGLGTALRRATFRREPTVVVLGPPVGPLKAALVVLLRVARVPVVVDLFVPLHEKYIQDTQRWKPRSPRAFLLHAADLAHSWLGTVTMVDTAAHARLLHRHSRRPLRSFVIYPPSSFLIDEKPFEHQPCDRVRIVWMGSVATFHGFTAMHQAVHQALTDNPALDAEIVVITPVEPYGRERIHVTVDRSAAVDIMARSDIVLGVFGGSAKFDRVVPYKVIDGLAFGLPVVTGRSPAVMEAVDGGVVYVDDPSGIPAVLADLAADPGRRAALGAAGRECYERTFSDGIQVKRLSDLCARLTS